MNESTGCLDQPLKILGVLPADCLIEPNLLENIVRFVIMMLIPAMKERAIIGMIGNCNTLGLSLSGAESKSLPFERLHKFRNSLAFVHEGLNMRAPAMMGKRARITLREGDRSSDHRRSEK